MVIASKKRQKEPTFLSDLSRALILPHNNTSQPSEVRTEALNNQSAPFSSQACKECVKYPKMSQPALLVGFLQPTAQTPWSEWIKVATGQWLNTSINSEHFFSWMIYTVLEMHLGNVKYLLHMDVLKNGTALPEVCHACQDTSLRDLKFKHRPVCIYWKTTLSCQRIRHLLSSARC